MFLDLLLFSVVILDIRFKSQNLLYSTKTPPLCTFKQNRNRDVVITIFVPTIKRKLRRHLLWDLTLSSNRTGEKRLT